MVNYYCNDTQGWDNGFIGTGQIPNTNLIVAAIEKLFVDRNWMPLLTPQQIGLRELPMDALQKLLPRIQSAGDRLAAVTIIAVAIAAPRGEDPPDDMTDSAILKLR